ncbi:hypothetical protein [Aquimarina sp. I32.4]|uniref:hypothetical protein n=1 Tax=Aquimarina sp. I32.4 TaxID=2053903 RepID=UPI000CDE95BA|nr:hypothetical protein [Aquimarina sp. I32.4]
MSKCVLGCLVLLFIVAVSCGYTKTEEDKHPDMPIFPEHTSNVLKLVKVRCNSGLLYRIDDQLLTFMVTRGKHTDYREEEYLMFLNNNFEIIDSLHVGDFNSIDDKGYVYSKEYENDEVVKQYYKKQKKTRIAYHTFDAQAYYDAYMEQLEDEAIGEKELSDSLQMVERFKRLEKVERKTFKEFDKAVMPELQCVRPIAKGCFILQYPDKELVIKNLIGKYYIRDKDIKSPKEIISNFKECDKQELYTPVRSNDFKMFDTAVTGNGSTGNHFVFGFYPKGYQYYELENKGDKTQFKLFANGVSRARLEAFVSPDGKNTFIINKDDHYKYYRVE